jgi:CheY-like chemotaxis protein
MRILFVDDVPDTRFIFRTSLELNGHKVRLAPDGAEAIAAVNEEPFDAIVMDLAMPELDGWTAISAIRQLPLGTDVPIIIFTAHFQRHLHERALQLGVNHVLQKPIAPSELLLALEQLSPVHS